MYRVFVKLEDAEFATAAAVKARKGVETEVQDLQQQLTDITKAKQDVCLSVCVSVCVSVCLSVCLFVLLSYFVSFM